MSLTACGENPDCAMSLLFRSRLRFSSSKIAPVLSVSEAHDRIVYSVREGTAVSSDPSCNPYMILITALLGLGMIQVHGGCGCCSLVPACQVFAERQ